MKKQNLLMMIAFCMLSFYSSKAQTIVNSLSELRAAVQQSNQTIVMTPGNYNLEDLSSSVRNIECSGSNNIVDLRGVYIKVPVGSVSDRYIIISGNNNTLRGLEVEDTYQNGMTEVTDFSAYNKDRGSSTVCKGLRGAPDITITGNDNLLVGFKLTVRGSYPYGYGSMYGIGVDKVFFLDKRCGINITGVGNTIDSTEVQQRAFGHGIYMQGDADKTVIKNTLVEGRTRAYAELYEETETYDLPYLSDYVMPFEGNRPIPRDEVFSLSEDGFRSYGQTGSVTLENCTAKMMRGGVRLYLASSATVTNCKSIDCGLTNYNVTNNGKIINSSGNFAFDNLLDFPLTRSNTNIEMTIIPSPHATGPHNIADIEGNSHTIVFHRTPGPLDPNLRPIVVKGDNSTITNETEYPIVLEASASGNTIISCGVVIDNGSGNKVTQTNCTFDAFSTIEAEDYTAMLGVETTATTDDGEGQKVSSIDATDWIEYEIAIPLAGTYFFDYRVSGVGNGDFTVQLNGETIDNNTFDATGGDEVWETIRSASPIFLTEGIDTIRIISNTTGWNLNWIALTAECYKSQVTPQITTFDLQGSEFSKEEQAEVTVFPGFSVNLDPLTTLGGSWSWTGPNGFSYDERVVSITDIQKHQGGDYIATFINACGVETIDTISINVQDSLYIEAEKFDAMSGVLVEETSDVNGDSIVTSIGNNDWMEYEINVPFSALYNFTYRVASENAGSFDLSIDTEIIDQVTFNSTGGAQSWTTINSDSMLYLKSGVQTIRISSKSDGWNLNWFELKAMQVVSECNLPYSNDGFLVRNEIIEWSSGLMDISCEPDVNVHVIVDGIGNLGESDYLNIYYKLDGGEEIVLAEKLGDIDEMMVSSQVLKGTTLEVIIKSKSESFSQYYNVSQIIIMNGKDPFARIEAEDYDDADGTNTENCSDAGGGENVGSIRDGNWLKFSNINLSEVHSINARLASTLSGGTIEVRLGSETGEIIGTLEMPNTGNWQSWRTVTAPLSGNIGFYDVYLVFNSSEKYVGNINWLQFSKDKISGTAVDKVGFGQNIVIYPNPVQDRFTITNSSDADLEVYNQIGRLVLKENVQSDRYTVSMAALKPGFYIVRVLKDGFAGSFKVIKE